MTKQELIDKLEKDPIEEYVYGTDVDPLVVEGKLNLILKYLKEETSLRGTDIMIDGVYQEIINFISDPQSQIDALKHSIAGNIEGIAHTNERIDTKLDKTQCTLDFNQLFDANKSTLPSGSGLVITNIYGGHHIEGTTTSQFYHKMYSVNTISGHKYYFAANFSEKANVYIVAKAGSTSFNTKDEKIFTGDTNFNITLQVERDKVISTDLKPILVDLTRMFGVGNEPQTTQEVQEYLVKGTYYPYSDKPSKAEVNSLSMCPSNTVDNNVFSKDIFDNQVGTAQDYTTPANGYIYLSVYNWAKDTYSDITLYDMTKNIAYGFFQQSRLNYDLFIPVVKGTTLRLNNRVAGATLGKSQFYYSKEI